MCQKSLIKESIKAKLEKLDDNISYEIDGKKIDIIVKRSRIEKKDLMIIVVKTMMNIQF